MVLRQCQEPEWYLISQDLPPSALEGGAQTKFGRAWSGEKSYHSADQVNSSFQFYYRPILIPPTPITGEGAPGAPSPQANASHSYARRLMPPADYVCFKVLRSKVIRYATCEMRYHSADQVK